ncbi:Uncharacterized phage-associated protein [Asanoa hainanensis]|uniref:Uncharacterized phage-associated protein n=1 Tax=Asanoa hainanensis TaxID=560556 RepID=A0A239JSG1_9ACTN|nr:Panacea domain-containing protein [Asanoa hainanensis]SNT07754.1 Uncharacterized phage-associated protein [Asanoa hainanensis]
MTTHAHDVAIVLRQRIPGIGVLKLHKLLYYAQGHHLATFGEPLFAEDVFARDNGPVVPKLWSDEREGLTAPPGDELGEAELNTVGYVISRYGQLTPNDLVNMTHQEAPWRLANASRRPNGSVKIRRDWPAEFFSTDGAPDDGVDQPFDSAAMGAWLREAVERDTGGGSPDDLGRLRARVADGS